MANDENDPKNPSPISEKPTVDQRNKKRGKKPSPDYIEPYIYLHDKKLNTYKVNFYMAVVKGGQPVYLQKSGIKGIMEARRVLTEFKEELIKRKDRFSRGDKKWKKGKEFAYSKIVGEENPEPSNDEYNFRKSLEKHTAVWDELYLTEITQQMVSDLVNGLKILEPATKNKLRRHISRVFQLNGLNFDPARQIKIKGYRKSNSRRLAGLTREEMARFIDYAKEKDPMGFGLVFEFAYFLSCRSGELWALEWDNLVKENGEYSFVIKRSYNWFEKRFKSPKNGEIREVGVPDDLLITIKKLQLNKPDPKYVLPRLKDWEQGQASKIFRKYLQDLKIIDSDEVIQREKDDGVKNPRNTIRFHDIRGVAITHSLSGSGDEKDLVAVMQRVGHKNLATTSLYIKKVEARQKRAVANNLNLSKVREKENNVVPLKKGTPKK